MSDPIDLSGRRLLVTGCSGFVGRSLIRFIDSLPSTARPDGVTGLARTPEKLQTLQHQFPLIETIAADCTRPLPDMGSFDLVIHCATPASAVLIESAPREMIRLIYETTANLIDWLSTQTSPPTVLFTSSGAVYDWSINDHSPRKETSRLAPDSLDPRSCYGETKRLAELMFSVANNEGVCSTKIARLFAFAGPDLPIDTHFAFGNFVRDAVAGRPILLKGNPATVRSYMWHTDMSRWILAVALRGAAGAAYNVGSAREVTIGELAETTSRAASRLGRSVAVIFDSQAHEKPIGYYVPETTKAQTELNLRETFTLDQMVEMMLDFHSRV